MKYLLMLSACIVLLQNSYAQLPADLSGKILNAYNEANSAYTNLDKLQSSVEQIAAGKRSDIPPYSSNWTPLVENYEKAANDVTALSIPTDFDPSKYTVSLNDMTNCYLRDINFKKLHDYANKMDSDIIAGNKMLIQLANLKKIADASQDAINYLKDESAKLSNVPFFGQTFLWNWFDLDQYVNKSLSHLMNAINAKNKDLQNDINKMSIQKTNLESNINILENSICLIQGKYAGNTSYVIAGYPFPVHLELTLFKNGTTYSGTLVFNVRGSITTSNSTSVTVLNQKEISFTYSTSSGSPVTWTGSLSQDYKSILHFTNGKTTCDLHK
jgi:hypothetical protein